MVGINGLIIISVKESVHFTRISKEYPETPAELKTEF